MAPGDVCLASFPFGDAPGMKVRPVLLLTGPVGPIPEVLVAYISSVDPGLRDSVTARLREFLSLDPG